MTRTSAERGTHPLLDALGRGWLVLLLLALLPASNAVPAPLAVPMRVALLIAALLAWLASMAQRRAVPTGIALLDWAREDRAIGAWELCLLAVAGCAAVVYIGFASRIHEIVYNDGAYYYGVARHIALSGRFEEPIVWHFLQPPAAIVHPPFDYWGCMTSLLLVPSLLLFGATPEVAILSMAVISAVSVLAFWYLICVALPLRYRATQLLALVIFAFSPAMDLYRFQPESIVVAQLFLLMALIALCLRRFVAAMLCGFCILLTRSDGLILFALIAVAAIVGAGWGSTGARRRMWATALVGVACIAVYALWSFVSFGSFSPPGPQILPGLKWYIQVYDYGGAPRRLWNVILEERFSIASVVNRFSVGASALRSIPFAPGSNWWLVVALVAALGLVRKPNPPAVLIWGLAVVGYFLLVWISGPGFSRFRTPYTFAPLIILVWAFAIDAVLDVLATAVERRPTRRTLAVVCGAVVFALCSYLFGALHVLERFPGDADAAPGAELAELDDLLRGEPAASNLPWYMIAYTRSPTVSIPMNGASAIERVLDRYRICWVVVFPGVRMRASSALLARMLTSDTTPLGRFTLQRVSTGRGDPAVFRVVAQYGSDCSTF